MATTWDHDVAIVGGGMSGICMGVALDRRGIRDFVILEKSADVGGTWLDNSYPGACCDVPSVLYSFSFAPNPDWSRKYSPQPEIQSYFSRCLDQFGLRQRLRTNAAVAAARYLDAEGGWELTLKDGATLRVRAVVSALGQLNLPNIPLFAGADSFSGEQFHSARWRHDIDLTGKRVAVIGNAASALQFIPHVARQAAQLHVYQRTANHVIPRNDRAFREWEKTLFRRFPFTQKLARLFIYLRQDGLLYPLMRGSRPHRWLVERLARWNLERHIIDPRRRTQLWPDYVIGCKRVLVSDDYYQTFNRPKVELVTSSIRGIGREGVLTEDGVERPVDVIIYGTGFRATEMLSAVDFRGRGGQALAETWREGAEAYRGIACHGFPNLFILYGPNTNLGSSSIIYMVEQQSRYIARLIQKLLKHELTSLEPSRTAQQTYNDRLQGELAGTVWASECDSWYKNAAGRIVLNWPRSTTYYRWHMRSPDFVDYELGA
ncbi:MAG: NAD(P)/FAD-dependent oxidoreductase [Pseudomonadota bacterium]